MDQDAFPVHVESRSKHAVYRPLLSFKHEICISRPDAADVLFVEINVNNAGFFCSASRISGKSLIQIQTLCFPGKIN